jgi:RND family efflux transporter MFP subunit
VSRDPGATSARHLRALFDAGVATGLTDGQLLERFATRRGESAELAFAALVERHGPMVLRACRGILNDDHEAMDAFQATFLVLVRKAGSLWVKDSLGPWLHRVACRAAVRARAGAARRRAAEQKAAEAATSRHDDRATSDLAAALHEEVDRLPERYRAPIVLCELEGRTVEEAARHLGCPVGTLKSWLSRGRGRLRDRLTRRGLAPSAGALGAQFPAEVAPAAMPAPLAEATARAAAQFLAGGTANGVVPDAVVSLIQAELRAMSMIKLKTAAAALAAGIGIVSAVALAFQTPGPRPRPAGQAAEADPAPATAVIRPVVSEVTDYQDYTGRTEAVVHVEVRARVSGFLERVHILPGMTVKAGDPLFDIDPRPYQAKLAQADALVAQAEAHLKGLEEALRQTRTLAERAKVVSQGELNQIEGKRDEGASALQAARAARDLVKLDLDATRLKAPIGGKVGRVLLTPGNLVVADTTPLATISSTDPVLVYFQVDERTVLRSRRLGREGKAGAVIEPGLPVRVGLADEDDLPWPGKVDGVDDRIDPASGTLRVRASLPNPEGFLLPGMFARVRLNVGAPHQAVLIPEGVVTTDGGKSYVFVAGDRNVIERRAVNVGQQHDKFRVVEGGVTSTDRIVVDPRGKRPGMTIKPEEAPPPGLGVEPDQAPRP